MEQTMKRLNHKVNPLRENILPFTQPQVYGFLGHAYVRAILENYEECEAWLQNNYIQLYISQHYIDMNEYRLDFLPDLLMIFANVPWLEYHRTDQKSLARLDVDIHHFIIDHIDRGYYCFTYVNDFYIPHTLSYQKYQFTHDIFIFGYDLNRQLYHVAIFDDQRQFSMRELSFEDFDQAYHSETRQDYISMLRKVAPSEYDSYKYDMKIGHYDFDLELMVDMMDDYLHGRNTRERLRLYQNPEDGFYGMDIYKGLHQFFTLLYEDKINLDVRQLHLLWEHKKLMISRILYLQEQGYLEETKSLDAFRKIEKDIHMLRSMLLKYFIVQNKAIITNIIHSLDEIYEVERAAIILLMDDICRKNKLRDYKSTVQAAAEV
ncbi:hypothetical protein J2Z69_001634 [Paenibacillus shirakamiensis]|uniref:Butirosin biosynthesis protein H N-terminal domain-containing protein n=1 Tax=Paenibacillus shirakamiensis TaxID=1265935 RepID=A0ABS4JFX2_9BACL|nr:hypothetical protein [Paenibacillus shirakamiensis]MBP2000603.1 hypothetical protein [Paenibacillus shirakamiensis]